MQQEAQGLPFTFNIDIESTLVKNSCQQARTKAGDKAEILTDETQRQMHSMLMQLRCLYSHQSRDIELREQINHEIDG